MALNIAPVMPPLQQQLWDKTLNVPLAGGIVSFYQDINRTTPKNVYELVGSGPGNYSYVSLGNVLTLSGIGTYVDANGGNIPVYLWPYTGTPNDVPASQDADNYYIVVNRSTGMFQFDIINWPGVSSGGSNSNTFDTSENLISNAQFVDVIFPTTATSSSPKTFNVSGNMTTAIAPDWSVITSGTGAISVWQIPIADNTAPGNPAYALGISSSGLANPLILEQTINAPRTFVNSFASGTFIAQAFNGNFMLTMNYTPSITNTIQQICSGICSEAAFTKIFNTVPVLISNPGSGLGTIQVSIVIPALASVAISCVQLCTASNSAQVVDYIQESPEREVDHLFHYFQTALNIKPVRSMLVGWDFALNPAQIFGKTVAAQTLGGTNLSCYVWDQTIIFQSADTSISVAQASNGAIVFTAGANTQMAMIQYLGQEEAKNLFQVLADQGLSVNIKASSSPVVQMTLSLWWTAGGIPSLPNSLVTALDANGLPSVVAGWTQIASASIAQSNKFINTSASLFEGFGFSYFLDSAPINGSAANFAIVIGTGAMANGNTVSFQSASVCPGRVPTIPAPQTLIEVLNDCRYYYENAVTGYPQDNYAPMSSIAVPDGAPPFVESFPTGFSLIYQQTKRTNSNLSLYSSTSTLNNVSATLYYANAANAYTQFGPNNISVSNWTVQHFKTGAIFSPNNIAPITLVNSPGAVSASAFNSSSQIAFGFIADARIGIT